METNMNYSVRVVNDVKIQLDRFYDTNYTRWLDKMVLLLISLNIYYILDPNLSTLPEPQKDEYVTIKIEILKREKDEVFCRGHILNTLTSQFYGIFSKLRLSK